MLLVPLAERLTRRALTARGVQSRHVATRIARHHVYDAPGTAPESGALPTIVLLHGISSSAAIFAPTITRLRRHARRVLAIDAPGHGLSGEPNIQLSPETLFESMAEVLLRELDEPTVLCGNSLGGAIALSFALRHPDVVRGLFLTSPAGARMDHETFRRFLEVFDFRSNGDARDFLRRLYHRPPWYVPLLAPDVRSSFTRKAVRDILDNAAADRLFSPEELSTLRMPIYLLWGKADRLLPRENFHFYKGALPAHAVIEEPEDMGHCPHFDDPRGYAHRIARFARGLVQPGAP
jgi:pimeloyl-ACP methyl ester carboxylesterase